ncbi:MAG: 2-hydroxyhepta-2,4-diene-1,7-dioate isomerase [Flavobacteriia bacterium]|jgi:2-dehydro-3-deoxy-D-arabinonate dehydratase|nr:2-hydroxyhepta-2,4-diene-1,7-dioate isomerase [Flavobacteriia bacterium]
MKLYRTSQGNYLFQEGKTYALSGTDWDELLNQKDLPVFLKTQCVERNTSPLREEDLVAIAKAPLKSQEVWAAGVTYFRSKTARMEESKESGGSTFYDKIYDADRPELFFKSTPDRVVGPGDAVRIRKDSSWSVPEPELTLVISSRQKIIGYTIGNDMSARDIEGENPLYLPQAKSYTGSAAVGPCILVLEEPLPPQTTLSMRIYRVQKCVFEGSTSVSKIKRSFTDLVRYLFLEMDFSKGCFLMTGTGIVPADDFTLKPGDRIEISIKEIGILSNTVAH